MTMGANSDYYRKGMELAKAGRYQDALASIEEHLRKAPDDAQALNDAGAILHCLGRSDEAIDRLVHAKNLRGDCAEIIWNLAEACLADNRPSEAVQLFDDMERMGILNVDIINRAANVFLNQDNKAGAIEILLRSLQLWPDQKILRPMIDVIRSKRPKIGFFCGPNNDGKLWTDVHEFTERRFPVQFFAGQSVDEMYELMKWSDICWFERCTDMVAEASRLPKVCKNIVRLHRFEIYDTWPSQVQWESIDMLIMVGSSFVKDALLEQVPDIERHTQLVTVPHGVNVDKFKFIDRQRGKNLACAGYLNMRKNPMFLLQCMQKLHYIDPEYRLFFAGVSQDPMIEQYTKYMMRELDLADVVFFDGWQEDMNAWLQDKHYIVSGSIGESQGMGLLEAMACGLKPVIHNFPGASEIFPSEFLFNISEEFCQQILCDRYEPERYRKFVGENYPLKEQLDRINGIFTQLEAEIDLQQSDTAISGSLLNVDPADFTSSPEPGTLVFKDNTGENGGIV